MTPPHWHISFEEFCKLGMPPTMTVGDPGIQGAAVIGIHGMGVSTPSAAAVAAATIGLAGQLHMPKGWILSIGT